MESIIMQYVDINWDVKYTIGSHSFIRNKISNDVAQVIWTMWLNHTNEEWLQIISWTEQDILNILMAYCNTLYFVRPN